MQHRELGTTGISLSPIAFGVWTLTAGWWGDFSEDETIKLIRAAYDKGITFFNTGNIYGEPGYAERITAKALADVRDEVVIGTTFGYLTDLPRATSGHSERPQDWSADSVKASLEESLKNLETDCIDIWQLHNPKMDAMQNDELWSTLDDLRSQGMVKAVGPSMGPRIGWRDEGKFAIENCPIDFIHHIFNMLEQDPGAEFNELAADKGIGILVRVPHSSGLLEDEFTTDTTFDKNDHRSHRDKKWLLEGLQKVDQIRFLMEAREEATMGQVALKWMLSDPAITSINPNIFNMEQLEEFTAAPDIDEFDADELGEVDTLYKVNFGVEEVDDMSKLVATT